ncbi:hypothetical protein ACFQ10_31905 [Streptomyces indonesiensis]
MRLSVRLLAVLRLTVRLLAGSVRRRAALGRLAMHRLIRVAVAARALRGRLRRRGGADGGGGGGVCGDWPGACG